LTYSITYLPLKIDNADENWLKVALKSMALGVGLYVIPLGMIANPQLIQLETGLPGALRCIGNNALNMFHV
jgi:hypothetical protein